MTLPERMFASGITDLIPVIPPGAALLPTSKIAPESIGKIPGLRMPNGLWCGYNWRQDASTMAGVRTAVQWGANIGLRTDRFPCVDIDCADAQLARMIELEAFRTIGVAPVRIGNAPKRALAYRTSEPFGRLRLWMVKKDAKYLVEILGMGQQYVVYGTHPKTGRPYEWNREPRAAELPEITLAQARAFLAAAKDAAEMLNFDCEYEGDGRSQATRKTDQDSLLAPSMDELRIVVDLLPNDNELAAGRDDWLRIGAAIKAAAGEAEEREAADLFVAWSLKWDGNDRSEGNDPDDARENFRRLKPPFAVGWPLLCDLAREHGYDDSNFEVGEDEEPEFETTPTPVESEQGPVFLSDQWLAARVVKAQRGVLRFLPAKEQWLVWDGSRWVPDAEMMAEDIIKRELRRVSAWVGGAGGAKAEVAKADKEAREICSSGKLTAVMRLVKSDRAIAVSVESLDHDPWILNTPGGGVNLKTGLLAPADPDQLCTRSTSVTPMSGEASHWQRFLMDTTKGDLDLIAFLKRWAGYCLTGVTREHQYAFIYGEGGNGKGTFVNAMIGVFDSYHRDSPMETFVASHGDRHPTELAALAGARLVTASETDAGKRWDEAKLKRMTGGDPITARGMRENFFTYRPQFKLTFMGNHRPEIRSLDEAMKRRTNLVPFPYKPPVVDKELGDKLIAEYPQILHWMIEGCLEWQRDGLNPPASVQAATEDYFDESDPLGQWISECTNPAKPDTWTPVVDLFGSWRQYAKEREHYVGQSNRFSSLLKSKGYVKRHHPTNRRVEFAGIVIHNQPDDLKGLTAE